MGYLRYPQVFLLPDYMGNPADSYEPTQHFMESSGRFVAPMLGANGPAPCIMTGQPTPPGHVTPA